MQAWPWLCFVLDVLDIAGETFDVRYCTSSRISRLVRRALLAERRRVTFFLIRHDSLVLSQRRLEVRNNARL